MLVKMLHRKKKEKENKELNLGVNKCLLRQLYEPKKVFSFFAS